MRFFRKFGEIALVLFLGINFVAAQVTNEETKVASSARNAYEQGLFSLAVQQTKEWLRRFPASANASEAQLIQARALYYQGQYAAAQSALTAAPRQVPEKQRSLYVFWQAEILQQLEKWPEAEKKYRDLIALLPPADLLPSGQLGLAWAIFKQGREAEARQLLENLADTANKEIVGARAALVLAKIQIAQSQTREAAQRLQTLLSRKPAPEQAFEANYWLGEIAQNEQRYADAVKFYQAITGHPKAFPRPLVAQAWFGLGCAYQKSGQPDNALAALEQAFTIAQDEPLKLAGFRLYLQCAQFLQRLPEAQAKLRNLAQRDASPLTASSALFAIASSQSENGQADQATSTLEALLTAYPDTPWRSAASYQLGQLYQEKGQLDAALKVYQTALESEAASLMQHQIEFKLGEIYFTRGDLVKAAGNFQNAAKAGDPIREKALFNLLLIEAQRDDAEAFTDTETQFTAQFAQSPLLARIVIEKAKLLERKGQTDQARQAYQAALDRNTDPLQRPFLLLRLADLLYEAGSWEEARKIYEEIAAKYPEDSRLPEAAYKAIWASYYTKKITADQTRDALVELAKKYPQDAIAPRVLFNAAEFYFNQQDYVSAQTKFEQLTKDYPQSDLVDEAQFFAGKAAIERKDLSAAVETLERIREASEFKVDARILQGHIYDLQGRFENAITLFDAVLVTEKTGSRFVEASLRKGDCLFALGATDPARYEQAAGVFGAILSGNQGNAAARNEAAFKRAKCFEKNNRTSDALALYLDVLNRSIVNVPGANAAAPPVPPEMFWRIKAGIEAARLRQNDQDWPGALAVYRKLEQLGGPTQQEFRDTINRLRREHFLFEEEPTTGS